MLKSDGAKARLPSALAALMEPLAAEVWVLDRCLAQVVLVQHRWQAWVPPGGKIEYDEAPREAAVRDLPEETGLRLELLERPAGGDCAFIPSGLATDAVIVVCRVRGRCGVAGRRMRAADGWTPLDRDWDSYFPEDPARVRQYVRTMMRLAGTRHPGPY
ncbi:NUDIX domain-containing protein [Actinoplanes sp. ATCC 53533]|uniref:NUDIX domain-containing protein n=1 Tax=Actinoplanes sp. ATCC 53533 TaxID=1288362 RepID=UPI0018F7A6F7|nr:NUDIX hydrolase [Actinoplanes sp. ATCC 53533]